MAKPDTFEEFADSVADRVLDYLHNDDVVDIGGITWEQWDMIYQALEKRVYMLRATYRQHNGWVK